MYKITVIYVSADSSMNHMVAWIWRILLDFGIKTNCAVLPTTIFQERLNH